MGKNKYTVYVRKTTVPNPDINGNPIICESDWKVAGATWAVSEVKAINNVRYRLFGKDDCYRSSHLGEQFLEFKAIKEE